jgi:hypothetical protein
MKMNMKKFAYSAAFIFAMGFGVTSSAYAKTVIIKYGKQTIGCTCEQYCHIPSNWSCFPIS